MSNDDKSLNSVNLKNLKLKKKPDSKTPLYAAITFLSLFLLIIFISIAVYTHKQNKEKENDKNLVGYALQKEELVDSCNLVPVEGFYLGKGTLTGEVHYIFQVEKNGEKSKNTDVTEKEIEINYVDKNDTGNTPNSNSIVKEKPGTIKAFVRTYTKQDKNEKNIKKQSRYFYKVFISQNTIKDCGNLSTDSENNEDE